MNDGDNTEGLEEWDGSVCRRHVSPGLLPPSEGLGGVLMRSTYRQYVQQGFFPLVTHLP